MGWWTQCPAAEFFLSQKVCMIGTKYDNLYRISTYHFYKVTIHCSSEFQRRKFVFISGNQKAELPIAIMFLSNRYEMRKSYRGPSIHASCKMLLYLIKWFQWRRFLEINQSETRMACGGHVC